MLRVHLIFLVCAISAPLVALVVTLASIGRVMVDTIFGATVAVVRFFVLSLIPLRAWGGSRRRGRYWRSRPAPTNRKLVKKESKSKRPYESCAMLQLLRVVVAQELIWQRPQVAGGGFSVAQRHLLATGRSTIVKHEKPSNSNVW